MILFSWASKSVCSSVGFWELRNLFSHAILDFMDCILCNTISGSDLVRSIRGIEQTYSNNTSVVLIDYPTHRDDPHLSESTSSVDLTEEALREFVTDSCHNDCSLAWCNRAIFSRVEVKAGISFSLLFWTNGIVCKFFESDFHSIKNKG